MSGLWDYRERLPVEPLVTLGEGGTPLVHAPVLSAETGADVWLKIEGANPTGSFKDRGMTVAVSAAMSEGATAVGARPPATRRRRLRRTRRGPGCAGS